MTKKTFMTWDEVTERIRRVLPRAAVVYGVPRGGAVVAGLAHAINPGIRVTQDLDQAELVVDDIIDSGVTATRFASMGKSFVAIVDKLSSEQDRELGWVVFPWEPRDETADVEDCVTRLLEFAGEDVTRAGLRETPRRFVKALKELTSGLAMDPKEPLAKTFDEKHDEVVCVKGMPFSSICEHHLLGFTGVVHFAYVPAGQIVGLSKIPRMVEILSRRPQVQERLATQIVDTFAEVLKPTGVMAVIEGRHSCMSCRGVRSQGQMVTSVVRGCFSEKPAARAEALALMGIK